MLAMEQETAISLTEFDQSYYVPKETTLKRRKAARSKKSAEEKIVLDGNVEINGDLSVNDHTGNNVFFTTSNGTHNMPLAGAKDYSANFNVNPLVDKGYVDQSSSLTTMQGNGVLANSNIGFYWDGHNTNPYDWNQWQWPQPQPMPQNPNPWINDRIITTPGLTYSDDYITKNENTINFMENIVQFFPLPGFEQSQISAKVVKNQVQIEAERPELEGYDFDDSKCTFKNAVKFDPETYDAKKVSVSFKNGLLRVEVPLREDIVSDITVE